MTDHQSQDEATGQPASGAERARLASAFTSAGDTTGVGISLGTWAGNGDWAKTAPAFRDRAGARALDELDKLVARLTKFRNDLARAIGAPPAASTPLSPVEVELLRQVEGLTTRAEAAERQVDELKAKTASKYIELSDEFEGLREQRDKAIRELEALEDQISGNSPAPSETPDNVQYIELRRRPGAPDVDEIVERLIDATERGEDLEEVKQQMIEESAARAAAASQESVLGVDRDDELLSLDDAAIPRRDALITLTLRQWNVYAEAASWDPEVAPRYERMKYPQVGDLVVEHTRAARSSDPIRRQRGFGFLLAERIETMADSDPDDPTMETAWYVQYGPAAGDVCRWVNCEFLTVPLKDIEIRLRANAPDPETVVNQLIKFTDSTRRPVLSMDLVAPKGRRPLEAEVIDDEPTPIDPQPLAATAAAVVDQNALQVWLEEEVAISTDLAAEIARKLADLWNSGDRDYWNARKILDEHIPAERYNPKYLTSDLAETVARLKLWDNS